MDYVAQAPDWNLTTADFKVAKLENPKIVFGDHALVIDPTDKTITVGDHWAMSDAAQEVVRIMAEHFGLERV
tara:strand:- start:378 stop:593 length:216 start_codon:yes stop_codon:yes gene_type:complete